MKKAGIFLVGIVICTVLFVAWPKAAPSTESKAAPASLTGLPGAGLPPEVCSANKVCGPGKQIAPQHAAKPETAATTAESQFDVVHDLLKDKRADAAAQSLLDILRTDSNNEHALVELAVLYLNDPRYRDKAVAMLEKVLERNPNNDQAMGELLSATQDAAEGTEIKGLLESVQSSYAKNPDSTNLAGGLGKLLVDRGDLNAGIPLLEKAAADPKFAESALNTLVETYADSEQAAKTAGAYQRLLAHQENQLKEANAKGSPEAERLKRSMLSNQIGLVSALISSGQLDAAERALRQLREQYPDHRELTHLTAQLEKARHT